MEAADATTNRIVVKLSDVSVVFGEHTALRDITLTADTSTRLGIIGESGSGKSTLARILVGALQPTEGMATVNETTWRSVRRTDPARRHVQMIHQDPYAQLTPHLTAHAAVSEAVRVCQGRSRRDADHAADEVLTSVGLTPELGNRKPRRLSGGQCQRVAIARALASNATLLVADEPTSALDVSVQAQIINLLLDITADRRRGLVLISHDLAVVRHLTEELLVLYQGEIVERGPTLDVLSRPQHAYTRRLTAQLKA